MFLKRLYFTMLELLVVIAILGLVAGFVGINIRKAVSEQNFRSEVDLVVTQMRLAQDLMLIFRGEVKLKFTVLPDGKGASTTLEFESKMPGQWGKEAKRVHNLTHIHSIFFLDELVSFDGPNHTDDEDVLYIRFLSNGSAISKGVMQLSNAMNPDSPGALSRYINLPGYPSPIESSSSYPDAMKSEEENEAFNKELTSRNANEVQFLKNQKDTSEAPAGDKL
jgi:prepilin-type N-terminal cleavage/methylation domain-containing protein